jgi:hypothetical protein
MHSWNLALSNSWTVFSSHQQIRGARPRNNSRCGSQLYSCMVMEARNDVEFGYLHGHSADQKRHCEKFQKYEG